MKRKPISDPQIVDDIEREIDQAREDGDDQLVTRLQKLRRELLRDRKAVKP